MTANPDEADDGSRALVVSDTSAAAAPHSPTNKDELPNSHQQRVDKLKRIRGGVLKSNRGSKKKKTDDEMTKALTSLMRTTKAYMKMRMGKSQQPNANKENESNQGNKSPDLQIWV